MLTDLSQGNESEHLSREWRRFIPQATKDKIAIQLRDLKRLDYLETETLKEKIDRLGLAVTQIKRYKLVTGNRTFFYTFELASALPSSFAPIVRV
jgi:hypothetical protein